MEPQEAASPAQTSSADVLETAADIERIFLRLVVADSDALLQRFTDRHLADIVGLAGRQPSLVPQITELLSHYNRRVKPNIAISLPVEQLVELFQAENLISSNLALIYLKIARDRLSLDIQVSLVPTYLASLERKPNDINFVFDLVSLCLPGLKHISKLDHNKWPKINLAANVIPVLWRVFRSIIVFHAQNLKEVKMMSERMTQSRGVVSMSGLSPEEYILVANKIVGENLSLTELKVAIINLLTKGFFDEPTAFPLLVISSAANINAVDDIAESALKKVDIGKCVDAPSVVSSLMLLYLGYTADAQKKEAMQQIQPVNPQMKYKIVTFLARSKVAPTAYMNNVKICLSGIDEQFGRLQTACLQFLLAIIENMPETALRTLGPSLFNRLRKMGTSGQEADMGEPGAPENLIARLQGRPGASQGGPVARSNAALCLVYRCMGALGKAKSSLVLDSVGVVGELLQLIDKQEEDVGYALVDCLVAWLPSLCEATMQNANVAENLRTFIAKYVTHENPKCRLVSLKYIEALINSKDMLFNWMLLNACGDSRDEMRTEATRLLEMSLRRAVPDIRLAVEYIFEKHQSSTDKREERSPVHQTASVHQMCARYIWAVAETTATGRAADLRIVDGDDHWVEIAPKIVKLMLELNNGAVLEKAADIALIAVKESLDVHQYRIASCFLSARLVATSSSTNLATSHSQIVAACMKRIRDSTRIELSQAIAFLLSQLIGDDTKLRHQTFDNAIRELETKNIISGLLWTCAAAVCRVRDSPTSKVEGDLRELAEKLVVKLIKVVADGYERPTSMLEAALGALGFVLQNFDSRNTQLNLSEEQRTEIIELCEKVAASRKDSLSQRAREAATRAVAWLVDSVEDEKYDKAVSVLYNIGEGPPQPELQFTVGDALIESALGPFGPSRRHFFLVPVEDVKLKNLTSEDVATTLEQRLSKLFDTIINDKIVSANHHLRRASLVWLLVAVQKLSKLDISTVRNASNLARIQTAFADGLTENDDFTQDVASKGMGVVYGMADGDLRRELVGNLMGALSEGRKVERKVNSDSVIFAEGQLGKTPTGENLTTYKELCSLATDLNQPDLVYKFMQLAKHNATWNAKKGAAFGFGAVLEQATEELQPYLGQLVPKLFRYRYDPDGKVQQSMRSIWSVLTQHKKNVVDEYADEIARELTPSLTHKEWRVRESACLAYSDLLRGHDTTYMHSLIPELLDTVLRVRDDIKESVRLAADKTAEALRRLIVRLAQSSRADEFLATTLPVLVDKGLNATVKQNKAFCLALLLELSKTAGRQLRPYLSSLIPTLLDAISDNEHAVLNYLAVRSDATQLEALDDARAHMARTSPMMTAIHDLLPHIDSTVLVGATPRLCEQLRASVGVSTRSAAATLVTQLALRAPQLLLDHPQQCDKLFHALLPGVRDRNASVRKQFANALSYLAKFVSTSQMNSLVKVVAQDLLGQDEDKKQAARHVLRNLSANCGELLAGYATQIVPYVFLETCSTVIKGDEVSVKKHAEWTELWSELVPSTQAAARLYKDEIVNVALDIIQNNEVWSVRAQAAKMLAQTAGALSSNIDVSTVDKIVTTLLSTLSGRIWAGKEEILTALAKAIASGGEAYKNSLDETKRKEIATILQREASKRNVDYSSAGLSAVASYAASTADVVAAKWLTEKVVANVDKITKPSDGNGSSSDEATSGLSNLEKEIRANNVVSANLVALVATLPAFENGQEALPAVEKICEMLSRQTVAWKAKQNLVEQLYETIENWQLTVPLPSSQIVESLFTLADVMCQQQRKTVAAEALQIIVRMFERNKLFQVDWNAVIARLKEDSAAKETGFARRVEDMSMEVD